MSPHEQTLEVIPLDALLPKVRTMYEQSARLVQIGATRLPEHIELTYSFDLQGRLASLRVLVPPTAHVPSVSSIYWCAFLYENEIHDLFDLQVDGMAVDFKGNLYRTMVKFPFGSTKPPVAALNPPSLAPAQGVGRSVPERREGAKGSNDAGLPAPNGGPGRTALPEQSPHA